MNPNTITLTVELGPETHAKLDKILEALQAHAPNCERCVESAVNMAKHVAAKEFAVPVDVLEPVVAPEAEQIRPEAPDFPLDEPGPHEAPEHVQAPAEPEAPKYTKDDIGAMVRKLAAPDSPKREAAKAIVLSYGKKVSDIPEDKYAEAMAKLTALEKAVEA